MKKIEIIKLLKFLNNYYQRKFEYPKENKQDNKMLQETWYEFLKEYDYKIIAIATKKLVVKKEWPPAPGEIMREVEKIKKRNELTGPEAWRVLIKAINTYSAFYQPDKVLENVPTKVAKAARIVGLQVIAKSSEEDTYIMNRYIKVYDDIAEKDFEMDMLPKTMRKEVEELAESKKLMITGDSDKKKG